MGLNYAICEFLYASHFFEQLKNKTGSTNVLTLGRQAVRLSPQQRSKVALNLKVSNQEIEVLIKQSDGYCESLLNFMGADSISSLDYSNYEGVDYTGNLNERLSRGSLSSIQTEFDAVFDFGTTQMVFNPAQSIENSLSFLKVGGALVLVLPVCGLINHGLYQFGPHFFDALANKDYLNVSTFYFEKTRSAQSFKVWKSLNYFFDFNYKTIMSFAVIQKLSPFSCHDFLERTQMVRYDPTTSTQAIRVDGPNAPTRSYKLPLMKFIKQTPVLRNIVSWILSNHESVSVNCLKGTRAFQSFIK